jgi:uncharacterized protein YdcH (DUF465 family)
MEQMVEDATAELEKLVAEHRDLDLRVDKLEQRVHLTAEEELEVHELKKLKLQKKDQIESLRMLSS